MVWMLTSPGAATLLVHPASMNSVPRYQVKPDFGGCIRCRGTGLAWVYGNNRHCRGLGSGRVQATDFGAAPASGGVRPVLPDCSAAFDPNIDDAAGPGGLIGERSHAPRSRRTRDRLLFVLPLRFRPCGGRSGDADRRSY